jgi:hypothetical protein
MRIGRALSGVSFGGIAFVDRPANKRSFILNHFAFDPMDPSEEVGASSDDLDTQVVTQTTLFTCNEKPMEVNMNDLNRAAASADEITQSVEKALDARARVEAGQRTMADLDTAVARVAELESKVALAAKALEQLQTAIDQAYAGATSNTPAEIAKIDTALDVKGAGSGDAVFAAKIAWIADSRKAVADALVQGKDVEADTKLIEENSALKAELTAIKTDLRTREITHLFAEILEMNDGEVAKFVEAGLAKASDEDYTEWLDEKLVFAKKMMEFKKKDKKKDKADDAEAGLLSPSQRETPVDDDAILRSDHGSAPADINRVPRSKISGSTVAAADLDAMFEEVDEPNLAAANAEGSKSRSAMGGLVAGLFGNDNKDKEV